MFVRGFPARPIFIHIGDEKLAFPFASCYTGSGEFETFLT